MRQKHSVGVHECTVAHDLRDTQANSRKIIKIKPHAINGTLLYMLVSWAYKNSTNRALELAIVKQL